MPMFGQFVFVAATEKYCFCFNPSKKQIHSDIMIEDLRIGSNQETCRLKLLSRKTGWPPVIETIDFLRPEILLPAILPGPWTTLQDAIQS